MSTHEIVCENLNLAIGDLKRDGFRLELIYPADNPHTAELSGAGERIRLTTKPDAPPLSEALAPFVQEFVLTPSGASAGEGRAGMLYRDLIPSRLGGRYIASHIAITTGGPVADWVHFHRIAFQMIYVRRGWVRVVYENEGDPFVMAAGDLVLQPPEIRHRVLESSDGLEVIEITAPAIHATFADHTLQLPNGLEPQRSFGHQRFLRHIAKETPWTKFDKGEAQETAIRAATAGLAEVRTIRSSGNSIHFQGHDGELVFGFVLDGSAQLEFRGTDRLCATDSFIIPPREPWAVKNASRDFRLLHVTTALLD